MAAAALLYPLANGFPPRKKFTRGEVERMEEIGLFEGQRFELLGGDLIDKMGTNGPHIIAASRLVRWLMSIFEGQIQTNAPIEVSDSDAVLSLPEPDIAVINEAASTELGMASRRARASEAILLIEIADTSLRQDSLLKRDLYARAGVPEYWILDIPGRTLLVFRKPVEGRFQEQLTLSDLDILPIESPSPMPIGMLLPNV